MILAETYGQLMTDPAHTLFEMTWEAVTLAVGLLVGRYVWPRMKERFHRDLDRAHGIQHAQDGTAYDVDNLLAIIGDLDEQREAAEENAAKLTTEVAEFREGLERVVALANMNVAAYRQEKERADALSETLAKQLRKDL